MFAIALSVLILAQSSPEADAEATLDRMHSAASAADGATWFAQFTPDARFIGTDVTERWTLAEFRTLYEPYFASGRGWTYVPRERVVTLAPLDCRCIAWFDEVLDNDSYGVVRGSGVLRLTEGGWKIEQYVLSFTVPNDAAREVTAVIRGQGAD